MITQELVERINYLSRKERYEGLTEEEKKEQHRLRQDYLKSIRRQITDAMDSAGIPKKGDPKN